MDTYLGVVKGVALSVLAGGHVDPDELDEDSCRKIVGAEPGWK